MFLSTTSEIPKPITGCPFVWIASTNMASVWQKRTSQLWLVNAGPAGSRPVKCLIRVIGVIIRGYINKQKLQQRNVYYYYSCYHIYLGYLHIYISETNHASTVNSFVAVLYLQFVLHVMLFRQ